MARFDSGERGTAVLAVVLLSVIAAGTVVAVPVSVSVTAPDTAAPGDEISVTYEIANEGEEPTDALGLNVTALPPNATVTAIETADGSAAPNRNAVFWVEPVDPGGTATATFVVSIDAGASLGDRVFEAEVTSSDDSQRVSTTVAVEDPAAATTAQQAAGNGTSDGAGEDSNGGETATSTTRSTEGSSGDAAAGAGSGALPGGLPLTYVAGGGVALAIVLVSMAVLRRR